MHLAHHARSSHRREWILDIRYFLLKNIRICEYLCLFEASRNTKNTLNMSLISAMKLGGIPAACMLLSTFLGLGIEIPSTMAGALQHFAAGILLCSIGTELLPVLVKAEGFTENFAAGVGFFLGVAVLMLVGIVLPEEDDEGDDEEGQEQFRKCASADNSPVLDIVKTHPGTDAEQKRPSLRQRQHSLKAAAFHHHCDKCKHDVLPSLPEEERPLVATVKLKSVKAFPSALLVAIVVDSALDGLLIGIVTAAGPSAGPILAVSLTVEMSFLGLTLATALRNHRPIQTIPAAIVGPAFRKYRLYSGERFESLVLSNSSYRFLVLTVKYFCSCVGSNSRWSCG
jgi:zinc transporter ZupT